MVRPFYTNQVISNPICKLHLSFNARDMLHIHKYQKKIESVVRFFKKYKNCLQVHLTNVKLQDKLKKTCIGNFI